MLRYGGIGGHSIKPRSERRVPPKSLEPPPGLEVRVLRGLGGIVGIPKDPEAQRVHLPVGRVHEVTPRSLVALPAALDQLGGHGLVTVHYTGALRTPHCKKRLPASEGREEDQ
jgi:hypothetical protein